MRCSPPPEPTGGLLRVSARPRRLALRRSGDGRAPCFSLRRTVEARRAGVTTSIGVACQSAECPDAEPLIEHADAAPYRAKADGRNRVVTAFGDVGTLVEHAPVS